MLTQFNSMLFGQIYTTDEVRECFGDHAMVQGWLDAEAALAQAQADLGIIPAASARAIRAAAHAADLDFTTMVEGIQNTGHPLVPTIRLLVERCGPEHGRWVHWGATTQDIIDTGMVLQLRRALPLVEEDLRRAHGELMRLVHDHQGTLMAGRTHLQHAVPLTFGQKLVIWADELTRALDRLGRARSQVGVVSLGGAVGTLASLGDDGSAVRSRLAEILSLDDPVVPWHTSRDRLRTLAFALGEVATSAERIGREIIHMQSTEVSELREPAAPEHVGSSTMPQKRNPFTSELMCMNARLAHGLAAMLAGNGAHVHERDMVNWSLEWFTLPSLVMVTSGVASKLRAVLTDLEVDESAMRRNLAATGPLIMSEAIMMSLARAVGHEDAHAIVHAAAGLGAATEEEFWDIIEQRHVARGLDPATVTRALDPAGHLGLTEEYVRHLTRAHVADGRLDGQATRRTARSAGTAPESAPGGSE